jgi:N-acetylglutamate synthase-like GNAT family acetyltransferase
MKLRAAVAADAAAIAALVTELGYPSDAGTVAARLARILGREEHLVLVAEVEGRVAAWVQAHARDVLESGFRVEIVGLVVSAACRRRGVGRELVRRAEAWAAQLGAPAIFVRSNTQRVESHAFYAALGFVQSKTQAVYRKAL